MHDNIDLEKIPDSGHGILSEFEPSLFHVDLQKLELVTRRGSPSELPYKVE